MDMGGKGQNLRIQVVNNQNKSSSPALSSPMKTQTPGMGDSGQVKHSSTGMAT